jgi:hypothetical protein
VSPRPLAVVLLIVLLQGGMAAASALRTACHIHPPTDASGTPGTLIGPFADPAACRAARVRLFGDLGRCHCTRGFSAMRGLGGMGPQPPGGRGPEEVLP